MLGKVHRSETDVLRGTDTSAPRHFDTGADPETPVPKCPRHFGTDLNVRLTFVMG